jgi:drug/metabolite transporter (DMT)-like permease
VLGLVGVVMIVRPATGEINPGQLIALAAAVGFAVSIVRAAARILSDFRGPIVIRITQFCVQCS